MQLFVVAYDRAADVVSLLDGRVYAAREEALAAARCARVGDGRSLFVVNIETAAPVLAIDPEATEAPAGADAAVPAAEEAPPTADDGAPLDAGGFVDAIQAAARSLGMTPEPAAPPSAGLVGEIETWECADCVYVVTCARSGIDRPVTCGSFQWKSA